MYFPKDFLSLYVVHSFGRFDLIRFDSIQWIYTFHLYIDVSICLYARFLYLFNAKTVLLNVNSSSVIWVCLSYKLHFREYGFKFIDCCVYTICCLCHGFSATYIRRTSGVRLCVCVFSIWLCLISVLSYLRFYGIVVKYTHIIRELNDLQCF